MADEPIDQRPRRRLFGRRRVESVEETPKVGQVTVTESSFAKFEALASASSARPSAELTEEVESPEPPQVEATEPEAAEPEEPGEPRSRNRGCRPESPAESRGPRPRSVQEPEEVPAR